ncbi:single-stranded-DNA-specific exonuclease RecJ [Lyticum sinuosum]|uniref:Single-stranded-DNA-specific exonuclease RecJ n=1 Tax=Lyticum sinuosum TaxID=1332059 RepID=A0AAE4VJ78_9RICK|nr:single-stranded-DNA-specific exonuclease RecJ [Lyticum sinuosum]MDZ5761020.1 Single-stranded-DNA-specific exonuclease RecJ [Lyticum sinuosum]
MKYISSHVETNISNNINIISEKKILDGNLQNSNQNIESNNSINLGYSFRGYKWNLLEGDINTIHNLTENLEISEILARILVNRGINTVCDAYCYLNPKLRDIFPDPFTLKDMDKGVDRLIKAIKNNEKVIVFSDYDVDGATSGALIYRFFKQINFEVDVYVPNRNAEGYSLSTKVIQKFKDDGYNVIITVDCGSSAITPVKLARDLGIDVIILDHHIVSNEMPPALALINPRRPDDTSEYKMIAAVTVALIFVIGLRQELRRSKWFDNNKIEEPDIMPLLCLVALGTVCDVMPLNKLNRILVKSGLHFIRNRSNVGISTLMDMMMNNGVEKKISTHHLGFTIGPRINAGGRIDESRLGFELLSTDDEVKAKEIVEHMERLNNERRIKERITEEEVINQIEKLSLYKNSIIIVVGEDWPMGVLGILASRIKERYHKPCVISSIYDEKVIKGSCRSIIGIDIGTLFNKAKEDGLLIDGGGHPMAGGFSIDSKKIEEWKEYLYRETEKMERDNKNLIEESKKLDIDVILKASSLNNASIINIIEQAMPFGHGNPQPRFMLHKVKIIKTIVSKSGNVGSFIIDSDHKSNREYSVVRCVVFRGSENEFGRFLIQNEGAIVNMVGTVQESPKLPDKIDFILEDIGIMDNCH